MTSKPQIHYQYGRWIIEGYDDLGFSTAEGAEEYYYAHLCPQRFTRFLRSMIRNFEGNQ